MEQYDGSITSESFIIMLNSIRERAKNNDLIYLFMDNATFHKTDEVKDACEELNITPVFNVAYRFVYNPCERYWS